MTTPPEAGPSSPLEGRPTRLHPLVLVIWTWRGAFSLIVLILVTGWMPLVGAAILAVTFIGILLRWMRFRWHLEPDAVVIHEGIIIRKRRVIRRDRIQTVDLERTLLHRVLGVIEVRIEAIGAQGTEGSLAAVDPSMADALRRTLLSRGARSAGVDAGAEEAIETAPAADATPATDRAYATHPAGPTDAIDPPAPSTGATPEGAGSPPEPTGYPGETPFDRPSWLPHVDEGEQLAHVPPERLVVAGLTGGRVGVAAALVGFFFQVVPDDIWVGRIGSLIQQAPDPTTWVGLRILLVMIVFALLIGFFLSIIATVFTHWEFTLSATDDMLAVRRGLLTEHRDTVPFRRIQAVRVEENLIRRLFGLASMRATVAGRAGASGNEGTDYLLPIGPRDEVFRLARRVIGLEVPGEGSGGMPGDAPGDTLGAPSGDTLGTPSGETPAPELQPMPPRARRRRWTRAFLVTGAVALVSWFFASEELALSAWMVAGAAAAAVLVPGLLLAEGAWKGLGWSDEGTHAVVREGVLNRVTTFVPVQRLQVLETEQNPFQRVAGLATLHLRVARPLMGSSPRALDLSFAGAERWRESLAERVGGGGSVREQGTPGTPSTPGSHDTR
jgi:putative membrane protein